MATLTAEHKRFIVQQLACFERPSDVRASLAERFGVSVTDSNISRYDPTNASAKELGQEWRALFEATRERFINDTSSIPIANKAYRLRLLQRQVDNNPKNAKLVREVCEQAAKEVGGAYLGKVAAGVADVDVSQWSEPEFLARIVAGEDPHRVAADRARWLAGREAA